MNLWGVIHGVHVFAPLLLEQNEPAHIVNTASVAGLISGPGIYTVTKHAIVALSETLFEELSRMDTPVQGARAVSGDGGHGADGRAAQPAGEHCAGAGRARY